MTKLFNAMLNDRKKTKLVVGFSALAIIAFLLLLEIIPVVNIFSTVIRWIVRILAGTSVSLLIFLDYQERISKGLMTLHQTKKGLMLAGFLFLFFGIMFLFFGTMFNPDQFVIIGISNAAFWFSLIVGALFLIISIYLQIKYKKPEDGLIRHFVLYIFVPVLCFISLLILPLSASFAEEGGNGITTCKSCGDSGVSFQGMCEDCANAFLKWHDSLD